MPGSEDFDLEKLDTDSENTIATFALTAIFASLYPSSGGEAALSLMKRAASVIMLESRNGDSKSENLYNFLTTLETSNNASYVGLISALSGLTALEVSLKEKLDVSLVVGSLDECSLLLNSLVFGYSVLNDKAEDFWGYLEKNQQALFSLNTPLSEESLSSLFSSAYSDLKFAMLNSGPKESSLMYILKYTNVESLFTNSQPILPHLMKDSEIQSYRISGGINYFYGFDPSILDCEQVEVGGVVGYKTYPCNRVSVRPRNLQFNQTITDGPYSSGVRYMADNGIALITSIKNSGYDSYRLEEGRILNVGSFFASYNSGWVFDEFSGGERLVSLKGDVAFANNADRLKSFPDGMETGKCHFLGSYTLITGAGSVYKYSGFNPILLRLNDADEQRIHSQLQVNLFDKQKRSGQLMAYAVSTDGAVLSSFSDGDSYQYPLLSIASHSPSIPFMGINLEFSSKTFNKLPAAKFNFGSIYYVPPSMDSAGGSFTTATDFSFTAFDFAGEFFDLSEGLIKFNKEIKNTQNFDPQEAFVNETVPSPGKGLIPLQSGSRLLQKALGFSNYKDCITGVEKVKSGSHYGVRYKFIGNLRPPEIEDEENKHVKRVGDTGVLKYVTGFGPVGNISPLLSKTVFGPLDSKTDEGLSGNSLNYKYLPNDYKADELSYAYVPTLNPARYYSGLFASERRQFLYPSAKKIHKNNSNKYFPHRVKLTVSVDESYSKSLVGEEASRYGAQVEKSIDELSGGYWVDHNFSHENLRVYFPLGGYIDYWTCDPLSQRSLNPHFQKLNGSLSISDGKLSQENLTSYPFYSLQNANSVNISLPNTPLKTDLKESYSFDIELNYNLPIKSLSDFLDYPEHSNKSFISTGDSEITITHATGSYVTGWTEKINIDVNNGCDPLFNPGGWSARIPLDNNENISGDSWNGLYLKSGTVIYPWWENGGPPYRVLENDKILVEASDNSSSFRLFLRNLKLFPTFVNNDQDLSYGSGNSLAGDLFSGLRQTDNFIGDLSVLELNIDSILNKIPKGSSVKEVSSFTENIPLNTPIEKDIVRTGKLYYIPEETEHYFLPPLSTGEHQIIHELYPELGGFKFFSGVDTYSQKNSGYYLNYEEVSNIKLTVTNAEVLYNRFPDVDELFEFHLTGKVNFSGELSYVTQEESCVITQGIHLKEMPNELDEFQKMGYFFDYCSPKVQSLLNVRGGSFPTKQVRRKSKLISGNDPFVTVNNSAPDYSNRFYIKTIPEFVHFDNKPSILGDFGLDKLLNPGCSLISSSSYDKVDTYDNGGQFKYTKTSKRCKVENNIRFYDAFLTDSLGNSGLFVEQIAAGALPMVLDINKQCKTFYGPNGSFISDLEVGQEKNQSITLVNDRASSHNNIRDDNKPTGAS